jgi:hypothetical protein
MAGSTGRVGRRTRGAQRGRWIRPVRGWRRLRGGGSRARPAGATGARFVRAAFLRVKRTERMGGWGFEEWAGSGLEESPPASARRSLRRMAPHSHPFFHSIFSSIEKKTFNWPYVADANSNRIAEWRNIRDRTPSNGIETCPQSASTLARTTIHPPSHPTQFTPNPPIPNSKVSVPRDPKVQGTAYWL